MVYLLSRIKHKVYNSLLYVAPVKKNKIVFNNFCGKGYGDNPKYIAEEILKRSRNLDLVWMVNDLHEYLPNGIRPVLNNSRKARYELATSKIIICNVKHALVFKKKKKTILYPNMARIFRFKIYRKRCSRQITSRLSK